MTPTSHALSDVVACTSFANIPNFMRYEEKGMASRIAMSSNYNFSMALYNSLSMICSLIKKRRNKLENVSTGETGRNSH
jgi:hypothetical protein